jgi:hypothetical protein
MDIDVPVEANEFRWTKLDDSDRGTRLPKFDDVAYGFGLGRTLSKPQ